MDLYLSSPFISPCEKAFCIEWFMEFHYVDETIETMRFMVKLTGDTFFFIKMMDGIKISTKNARGIFPSEPLRYLSPCYILLFFILRTIKFYKMKETYWLEIVNKNSYEHKNFG